MMLRRFSRVVKYGLYGGVAIGGLTVATVKLHDGDYNSIALVRAARTAVTAVEIGRVYKKMLYSKEWDVDTEEYYEVKSRAHKIAAEKLLELCRANKGVYIKVGQHIGALDYLLPSEYVKTMRILHSDAPQNELKDIYRVIKHDLKKDPEEIFTEFEPKPLGTASLAQVHKAKLKDGNDVAVKVQHYFVKNHVKMDLLWMEFIIKIMSKVFPEFQMQWLVDETKKNIHIELDFLQEGKNAEKVAEMFSRYSWLKVPKIYWDYSSSRVLTMEYVVGGQVNDIEYIEKHNINKISLCKKIGDLYSEMIFVNGFVHSDPHPGNILVHKEPKDKDVTVYLLDHGLYARLTDDFRYHYSKLWLAVVNLDYDAMKEHSVALGVRPDLYGLFVCMVTARPWESVIKGLTTTSAPNPEEKKIFQKELPKFLHHITHVLDNVDRQALLVLKTNDLIRSIESTLGLRKKQSGFMVMTQCCHRSVYNYEYKNARSAVARQRVNIKYLWTYFKLILYGIYFNLIDLVHIG